MDWNKTLKEEINNQGFFIKIISFLALSILFGGLGRIIYLSFLNFNDKGLNFSLEGSWINFEIIPFIIIIVPLIGALMIYLVKRHFALKSIISLITGCTVYLLVISIYPQVIYGNISFRISNVLIKGLNFKIDFISYFMLLVTSILWIIMLIYSYGYLQEEKKQLKFYIWASITFSSILGTILAEDFFTMFLFFEIMTFSSYFLVVYYTTKDAIEAGNIYIYMGIGGGLCILLAMILTKVYTGVTSFDSPVLGLGDLGVGAYIIGGLFIAGFGLKAGMFPLYFWLPKAYAVTITPVNIISSGIMIKIGAYGLLRIFTSLFMVNKGEGTEEILMANISKNLGAVLIWLGIATMLVGVFMALQQGNIKKMLAYHSVSQMGYIIMGIGIISYLGEKGSMALVGSLYHILNHTLFKVLLFMVAGAVYLKTKEINMYKLGGLWRKMPFTAALCLIAALGITGMPLFNGFASKSILHHAIDEAYLYGHYSFKYGEILFTLVSGGTVCSFIKLFSFVFLGKNSQPQVNLEREDIFMTMAMATLASLIIIIGIFPNFILDFFLVPLLDGFNFDKVFIEKYIVNMNFFHVAELTNALKVYILGGVIFILGKKYNLFHIKLPKWFSMERNVLQVSDSFIRAVDSSLFKKYEIKLISYDALIYAYMLGGILYALLRYSS